MFADDTKVVGMVATKDDVKIVQKDLYEFFSWSE
jgi:hypothetical protein